MNNRMLAGAPTAEPGEPGPARPGPGHVALFAAVYVGAAALGQFLVLDPGLNRAIWPPSGLYLAVLVLSRQRDWPWLVTAALFADTAMELWLLNFSAAVGPCLALSHTLGAVLGAVLVRWCCGTPFRFEGLRDLLGLALLGAVLSAAVSATLCATTMEAFGVQSFVRAWPLWWVGNAAGVLIAAPLMIAVLQGRTAWPEMNRMRWAEAAALVTTLVALTHYVFSGQFPLPFIIMPPMLWAAARFRMPGMALATTVLTVMVVNYTAAGHGLFAGPRFTPESRALLVQSFLGIVAASALVVVALDNQHTAALRALRLAHDELIERSVALRDSEERLQLARRAAGLGIYDLDFVTGALRWDDRVRELWGVPSDAVITHEMSWASIHEEDRDRVRAALAAARDRASDGRYYVEYRVINRVDGVTRWVAAVGQTFFENGRAVRLVGTVQDITSRKEAEVALRDSEERLRLAAQAAEFGTYDYDFLRRRTIWSPELFALTGLPQSAEVDQEALLRLVHPGDRQRLLQAIERAADPAGPGQHDLEFRILREDGEVQWHRDVGRTIFAGEGGARRPVRVIGTVQDITMHKAAEAALANANAELEARVAERTAALRASEARLRSLVELSSDWYWQQDENFRFVNLSDMVLEKTGLHAATHNGKARWELPVIGVSAAQWEAHRALLERHEKFRDLEFCRVNDLGETIWISTSGDPIFDESGRFTGYRGVGRNITERKRADEELARAKERLELALQASSEMIFESDLLTDMVYLYGSPNRGGPRSVAVIPLAETHAAVHPEDLPRVRRGAQEFRSGTTSEVSYEYRLRLPSGEWSWRLLRGRVVQRDPVTGRALRAAGTSVDITARKKIEEALRESEERLRLAAQATGFGTYDYDPHGPVLVWSAEYYRIVGLPEAAGIDEERAARLVHPDDRERVARATKRMLDPAEPELQDLEYRIARADGQTRWLRDTYRVLASGAGAARRVVRVVGTVQDITVRRQAEEAQAALAQVQRMEAIGQLAGGLAHDMNNLLTVVLGNLELAQPLVQDEKVGQSLRRALDATEMGANLTGRLLTFARQGRLAPTLLHINERVRNMVELLQRTLGAPVTLTTRLAPELWRTQVDPSEIESAILNLALNARDAMPHGGSLVVATSNISLDAAAAAREPGAAPGDYVRLTVTDTGCGMTRDVLARAVEPFFTTKEVGKGTGLGLSSAYGFAKQSGGFLLIDSEVGKGTSVSIYLPRAAAAAGGETHAARSAEAVPLGDGELVIVVEDDDQVREVTLNRMEGLGYSVLPAKTGAEAIELLKSGEPAALVLSDVVMPGSLSGYDVASWVRRERPDVKVLLTSGFSEKMRQDDDETIRRLKVLGKPYSRAQLGVAVRDALAG